MRARRYQSRDGVISPAELEFLAEEERITIVSKMSTTERDAYGRAGYLSMLAGALTRGTCSGRREEPATIQSFLQGLLGSLFLTKNLTCPSGSRLSSEHEISAKSKCPLG